MTACTRNYVYAWLSVLLLSVAWLSVRARLKRKRRSYNNTSYTLKEVDNTESIGLGGTIEGRNPSEIYISGEIVSVNVKIDGSKLFRRRAEHHVAAIAPIFNTFFLIHSCRSREDNTAARLVRCQVTGQKRDFVSFVAPRLVGAQVEERLEECALYCENEIINTTDMPSSGWVGECVCDEEQKTIPINRTTLGAGRSAARST